MSRRKARSHGGPARGGRERPTREDADGESEREYPGLLGAQDTFYVGSFKGVGRIYQQTFLDAYSKVAAAKLYPEKTPITAADLLNQIA
jgi:hypothetical protein